VSSRHRINHQRRTCASAIADLPLAVGPAMRSARLRRDRHVLSRRAAPLEGLFASPLVARPMALFSQWGWEPPASRGYNNIIIWQGLWRVDTATPLLGHYWQRSRILPLSVARGRSRLSSHRGQPYRVHYSAVVALKPDRAAKSAAQDRGSSGEGYGQACGRFWHDAGDAGAHRRRGLAWAKQQVRRPSGRLASRLVFPTLQARPKLATICPVGQLRILE
jgi:hypothetical protein